MEKGTGTANSADKPAPAAAVKEPAVTYPHLARFEKLGVRIETLLEQVQGPIQLALFPQQVGDAAPDNMPLSPLLAIVLKDPTPIEQSLDAAAADPEPRLRKEVLNGGTHYVITSGNAERRPGFWLRGQYLLYSTDRDLIDMAGVALKHEKGTERMSDRPTYKQALTAKRIERTALLSVFGDADQILEMPYKLAKVNWEEDPENPWPDFKEIKALIANKPVAIQFKAMPEGLVGAAQTPLSIFGMIEAFRLPFAEAGY
jgi:hypothetical protein